MTEPSGMHHLPLGMAASPLEAKGVSSANAGAAAKASTNEAPAGPRLRCEGLQQCAMAKRLRLQSSFGPPNEQRELSNITHSLGHAGTSHRLLLCSASTPRSRLSPAMHWPAIKYINDRITTLSTLWSVIISRVVLGRDTMERVLAPKCLCQHFCTTAFFCVDVRW